MLHSFLKQEGFNAYPSWAYSWAGGQALARYILDNNVVKGKTVIDYCCGSGIVGIAAKLAGAKEVICVDNDPMSLKAVLLNARANGVDVSTASEVTDSDIVLAGDPALQESIFDYLRSTQSIIGCPMRKPNLLDGFISLESYNIPLSKYMGEMQVYTTHIFQISLG